MREAACRHTPARLIANAIHAGDAEGVTQAAVRARMAAPSPRAAMRAGDEERGRAVRHPLHTRMQLALYTRSALVRLILV